MVIIMLKQSSAIHELKNNIIIIKRMIINLSAKNDYVLDKIWLKMLIFFVRFQISKMEKIFKLKPSKYLI